MIYLIFFFLLFKMFVQLLLCLTMTLQLRELGIGLSFEWGNLDISLWFNDDPVRILDTGEMA